jgi:2-oxoglutarate ferredoxin oxidoreductase subunit gamma
VNERYEVRISGTGGQGVALTGIIMAEAAGRWMKGQYVVQTVSYGPEVRGGMSNAELVISPQEIDYPKPIKLDLLVPFTQEAANEGAGILKPNGVIIQDPALVHRAPQGWVAPIALTDLAVEISGRRQMANIVALGAISVLCPYIDAAALTAALGERAPAKLGEVFQKAAAAGRQAAEDIRDKIVFEKSVSPID